jgi:hypothetical protein
MRPEVVKRIKKAVMALDYRPTKVPAKGQAKASAASAPKPKAPAAAPPEPKARAPLLGLLAPSIANPFFGVLASEIERAAHANGYRVLFGNEDRPFKLLALAASMAEIERSGNRLSPSKSPFPRRRRSGRRGRPRGFGEWRRLLLSRASVHAPDLQRAHSRQQAECGELQRGGFQR